MTPAEALTHLRIMAANAPGTQADHIAAIQAGQLLEAVVPKDEPVPEPTPMPAPNRAARRAAPRKKA